MKKKTLKKKKIALAIKNHKRLFLKKKKIKKIKTKKSSKAESDKANDFLDSNEYLSDDSITLINVSERKRNSATSSPVTSPSNGKNIKSPKISLSLSKSRIVKEPESPEVPKSTSLVNSSSTTIVVNGLSKKRKLSEQSDEKELKGKNNAKNKPKEKRIKIEHDDEKSEIIVKKLRSNKVIEQKLEPSRRCKTCLQVINAKLKIYPGHPNNALEEHVALTDPNLCVESDANGTLHPEDARPSIKITEFCVYDKEGHLCAIDSGLVENNVLLYFSGYLKRIDAENATMEGGVPVKDAGPINEWWVTGYDGGERALIGISTPVAEYYLMEPHPDYADFMICLIEKVYTCKLVIELLLEESNPTFEDLLNKIQTSVQPPGVPKLTEDILLKHAQFVCDQVISFGTALDDSVASLITTPCMRTLVRLAAITFVKRKKMKRSPKNQFKVKKTNFIKATTTPLVKDTFDSLFTNQLEATNISSSKKDRARFQRCGVCEICQLPDCGTCVSCRAKVRSKRSNVQACLKRKCPNIAIQEVDESDPDDEEYYQKAAEEKAKLEIKSRQVRYSGNRKDVKWIGQPIHNDGRKTYYRGARVGGEEFVPGDCVSVEPVNSTSPLIIGRIMYMWENKIGQKHMHTRWFCRGTETVLGETADPQELFVVDECDNALLSCINSKVKVVHKELSVDWAKEGGYPLSRFVNPVDPNNEKSFFYQKRYNVIYGRFEDLEPSLPCTVKLTAHRFCVSCDRLFRQRKFDIISVDEKLENDSNDREVSGGRKVYYGVVRWRGEEYRPGNGVFLAPRVFQFKSSGAAITKEVKIKTDSAEKIDEDLYPEQYRKSSEYIKGCNTSTPSPFCIGLITAIKSNLKDKLVVSSDVYLKVVKFYRPENTNSTFNQIFQADLNMLYISEEEVTVSFEDVMGKCTIACSENIDDLNAWTKDGPNRFYFRKGYNAKTHSLYELPKHAKQLGSLVKRGRGRPLKSEIRLKESKQGKQTYVNLASWPQILRPLRCLDVFAGCGGLSEGLHQSGVAETKWAIEHQSEASEAFRLNNPTCTVFNEDCNVLLRRVMNGDKKNEIGQKLPQKGDVELMCGGPPCQGFSGMNRFNSRQYYLFKNSLIVTYLSYCDYYRPRFFILENVRNFVSFKRSMVLKLTIRCLQRMGYQVAFGVLQAGNYGVPQTRRRAIIIAAAPGEILPNFPEPLHVFNPRETQLTVVVDDKKFIPNCRWTDSAPYRTITVRDAISDLPKIPNGAKNEIMSYGKDPISHYQKMMRRNQTVLRDHICKDMAPIVIARIAHIPTTSGSDWRDLPNIIVKLSDDTYTQKLQYTHRDKNNKSGPARGVCSCAEGKPCNPADRQYNTLIPWCLPHTGNRNNNWAGLYGRLDWNGFFSTTTTNPEPMSKQGRVLHPEQIRVVSVRECARSQGFYDSYKFYGSILDKHRQVGNAVPPPLGAAIGKEIRKSISITERNITIKQEVQESENLSLYDTS